jgi:hypothetical protein
MLDRGEQDMSGVKEYFAVGNHEAPTQPFSAEPRAKVEEQLSNGNPVLWMTKPVAELKVKLQPVRKAQAKKEGDAPKKPGRKPKAEVVIEEQNGASAQAVSKL